MKQLTKLKCKYCSWCEAINCKNNKAKCHKYSKRLLNKKLREYKTRFVGIEISGNGEIADHIEMDLDDLDELEEYIEIPLVPNEEKEEGINPDDVIRARMEEVWEK